MQEQVQIVTFDDDKAAILERPPAETTFAGKGTNQFADAIDHSVVSFLERPQLIAQEVWTSSMTKGSKLFEKVTNVSAPILIPERMLTNMIKNKLDGFSSFRATAVFRIQVNAQPFQQGRLLMAAIPMPTLISPRNHYISSHISLLQAVNHVQLDINKQSEVTLRVPFVSPFNAYDLIHGQYPWAQLVVAVYSELREVEQVGLEVLLWANFEDVELGAPTSAAVVQQSGVVPSTPNAPQIAQTRQQEQGSGGSMISNLADAAMSAIPGGSAISGIANGIGSLFGFSKPNQDDKGSVIVQRPAQYFGNVTGIDQSHVLALDRLNAIDEFPGLGGTDLDECSMEFLTKIPQYISSFTFNKCNKYGDILWKTYVAPTYYIPGEFKINASRYVSAGAAQMSKYESSVIPQPTILNYVSSPFMYWTGSLVYTLRFMKTDFHSGRIEIAFHPYASAPTSARFDYVYRLVVDLRETSEVSFVVPYISPTPWKAIKPFNPLGPVLDWGQIGAFCTGTLSVRALTPLLTSNTVVNNCVECVVEVRAGDDYKVQGPTKASFYPTTLVRPTNTPNQVKQQAGEVFSLAGTQETRTAALSGFLPPSITNNASDIQSEDTQKLCAGEIFENYRALTRRFAFVDFNQAATAPQVWTLRTPYYLRPPQIAVSGVSPPVVEGTVWDTTKLSLKCEAEYQASPLCFVSSMYAFYRGSLRAKIYAPDDPALISGRVSTVQTLSEDGFPGKGGMQFRYYVPYMSPIGFEQPNQKRIAEYQIPFYSPCIMAVHWDYRNMSYFDQSQATLEISTTYKDSSPGGRLYLAVAAGDDMNFHGFLGVPFCLNSVVFLDWFTTGIKTTGTATERVYAYNWDFSPSRDPTYPVTARAYQGKPYSPGQNAPFGDPYITIDDVKITHVNNACPITPIDKCQTPLPNPVPPGGFPKYPWEKPQPIVLESI